jgi:tetratricopeptide (TPR) repeat protein
MLSPLSVSSAALYQQLLDRYLSYEQLGDRLIYLAEQARTFRQIDTLSELALVLSNLPIERYRTIGQYYLALTIYRKGQGLEQAAAMFEEVASDGPLTYRAEAMLSLSSLSLIKQEPDETIRYCLEAAKAGNLDTSISALKAIAILKGLEGHHRAALNDLEKLYPMFRYASPYTYFDYMNSYAVELAEVGRLQEARGVSSLVISSPFAAHYPECRETFSEVSRKLYKNRSSVTVPAPKEQPEVERPQPKDNVIAFPKKEPPADDLIAELGKFESVSLTPLQLLGVILKVVLKERITSEEIDRICNAYYQMIREYYVE